MYECICGRAFPGTLDGAWAARQHAEAEGHPPAHPREAPFRRGAAA